jgi:hypothetical protein
MPLPKAVPRNMLHTRQISLHGYQREDGLLDIEAHMTDTKPHSFRNLDRDGIASGEPIHDMWLRLTISRDMTIIGSEAAMDATPHAVCPGVAPNYQRLVGLNISKGFIKAAMERLGGVEGCTHLRELLQQMGTVAFQTVISIRFKDAKAQTAAEKRISPALLNTCYAYNENGALAESYRIAAAGK